MKKLLLLIIFMPLCLGTAFGQLTKDLSDRAASPVTEQKPESKKKSPEQVRQPRSADASQLFMLMGGASLNANYKAWSLMLGVRTSDRMAIYVEGETNNFKITPLEDYKVRLSTSYYDNIFWSGERKVCRSNVTAGVVYNLTKWLGLKAGAGYGFYYNLCEDLDGHWYDYSELSTADPKMEVNGALEVEAGLVFTFGRVLVGGGVQYCLDSVLETNVSIGFTF